MSDETEWISVREASRRLGRSAETIRRQIREGTFEHPSEREPRAKGDTRDRFIIRLPKAPDDAPATRPDASLPYPDLREAVAALERQFDAQRQEHASERVTDASIIRAQAEEIGALKADLAQARADLAAERGRRRFRWWWQRD
jgi:hypothetical protein